MSYITAIETAVPDYVYTQKEFADFYSNATDDADTKRKIHIISTKTGIEKRYSVLKDYNASPEAFEFYSKSKSLLPEPGLSKRMEIFNREAVELSLKAIRKIKKFDAIKETITHIITVTCTGLFAPGLDIQLIQALHLDPTINRSSINFMGCNAAILALKQADVICKSDSNAKVLIVCTELCTLHFQRDFSDDYIISNQLFGDGCAAVLVSGESSAFKADTKIQIESFHSLLLHKGYKDMAWQLSETGFKMNLTSYVSDLISSNMKKMLDEIGADVNAIDYWAIHPGGKKILEDFEQALQISSEELKESFSILRQYGNMSSPTVLFVLKEVIEKNAADKGQTIFSAAFGPGISIETMQLKYA